MIQITVNGSPLVLYKDTAITMELTSPVFNSDGVCGDVVYSFDFPIKGNELAIGSQHDIHTEQKSTFQCVITCGGVQFANGEMHIQKITANRITAGVVVNPLPNGFADRSVRDNEAGVVTVSHSNGSHKAEFLEFLKNSTQHGANFKFAPVLNATAYGSANEDFGFWEGVDRGKYINRLFFSADKTPIAESDKPFIRIFPKVNTIESGDSTVSEYNQVSFCPQVRLLYILETLARSAGYALCGGVLQNDDFKRLYVQSSKSIDAPSTQYDDATAYYMHASTSYNNTISAKWKVLAPADSNNSGMLQQNGSVRFHVAGFYEIHYEAQIGQVTYLQEGDTVNFRIRLGSDNACVDAEIATFGANTEGISFNDTVYIPPAFTDVDLYVGIVIERPQQPGWVAEINPRAVLSIRSKHTEDGWLNVYAKEFAPARYFPNLTNSEFLKAVADSFGIALFVDANTKRMHLEPCEAVMNAAAIDLTEYLVQDRTEVVMPEETNTALKFTPVSDNVDIDDFEYIGAFPSINELPDQYINIGKVAFVESLNAYYEPQKVEDETYNYRLEWRRVAGNVSTMVPAEGPTTSVEETAVKIPHTATIATDTDTFERKQCCEIPFEIEGYINSGAGGLSDIVAMYYRGHESFTDRNHQGRIYYEDMVPYKAGGVSLTTTGGKSWGEKYLRKWWGMYTKHKTVTYTFLLPMPKLLELIGTIRPQDCVSNLQKRALVVDGVKAYPKTIRFELFGKTEQLFVSVECAVR